MKDPEWKQIEHLLVGAVETPTVERDAFWREAHEADGSIALRAKSLFDAQEGFLEEPIMCRLEGESQLCAGDSLGPYLLLQLIGEGGMGKVFLAEQEEPVRRLVALKSMNRGLADDMARARFDQECQILAQLSHVHIAQFLNKGYSDSGRPYFTTEYCPGLSILEHVQKNHCTIREKLELFIKVCDAVAYANFLGVVHRDIKPANILIVEQQDKFVPKVIDFGIAKMSGEGAQETLMRTQEGILLGTLSYMSPEQADGSVTLVDMRTDVYSLGATLYQLLTGVVPLPLNGQMSFLELQQVIMETSPQLPSTCLSNRLEEALREGTVRVNDQYLLKGDLDWIVMKALDKDPEQRYGSPKDLANDLRAYLEDRPVSATPPETIYLLYKYIKRHRMGAAVFATVFLALISISFVLLYANIQQRKNLEEIRAAQLREQNSNDMLGRYILGADPFFSGGRDTRLVDMLENASLVLADKTLPPDSAVRIHIRLARTYLNLDEPTKTQEHLSAAQRLIAAVPEKMGSLVEQFLLVKGFLHFEESEFVRSEESYRQALILANSRDIVNDDLVFHAAVGIARALRKQDKKAVAEQNLKEMLRDVEMARPKVWRTDNLQLIHSARRTLANIYFDQNRNEEALAIRETIIQDNIKHLGPEHPFTNLSRQNKAIDLAKIDRCAEAEVEFALALKGQIKALGENHRETLLIQGNMARLQIKMGSYHEALEQIRDAKRRWVDIEGDDSDGAIKCRNTEASCLMGLNRYDEAVVLFQKNLRYLSEKNADESRLGMSNRHNLGEALLAAGAFPAAIENLGQALAMRTEKLGRESHIARNTRFVLARAFLANGDDVPPNLSLKSLLA